MGGGEYVQAHTCWMRSIMNVELFSWRGLAECFSDYRRNDLIILLWHTYSIIESINCDN